MRRSTIAIILGCATAVSALTLPLSMVKRVQLVDLAQFGNGFQTIALEEAEANTAKNNADHADVLKNLTAGANPKTASTEAVGSQAAGTCTAPATRVEWRSLSDADRTAFVQAVKCLIDAAPSGAFASIGSQSRYEDLVAVHIQMTDSIHMLAQFLPWHRYYLHAFQTLLRDECSYTAPIPWWDETLDAGDFANAPLFTPQWFGLAPLIKNGKGACVEETGFGEITIHVGGSDQCLARAVDESQTAQCNNDYVNNCNRNALYSDMESCSEYGPHGLGHNGIGAIMSQIAGSPSDPAFFMHHGFVDHSWVLWQDADSENRLYQVNGCSDHNNPCTQLTTDYVLSSQGLIPDATVEDVMDTQGGYLCYIYGS